jgi:chromosomal replication initiation ATPase DnaA
MCNVRPDTLSCARRVAPKDGRVLADDRFLEQVLEKRIHPTPKVSLDEIMTYVSAEYGVNEEDLRGPSRNRVVCEARAVIGWLSWRLESSSITDVASYFQRGSCTFSRPIRKIDAKAKNSDKLRDRLNGYINTLMQARPLSTVMNLISTRNLC